MPLIIGTIYDNVFENNCNPQEEGTYIRLSQNQCFPNEK
jgi:hypothetical protein